MTGNAVDTESFASHRRELHNPGAEAIRDAFVELPKRGAIRVRCGWDARGPALEAMESCGFFALEIRPSPNGNEVCIDGLKGKAGPCYETGRTATYRGAAVAAMDDDHHVLTPALRVCEKTAGLYRLPPYRTLISVTDADPVLLGRLDTAPVPFDCDTYERDLHAVRERLPEASPGTGTAVAVLYPGPFRLLVLADGRMLRRGACVAIDSALAETLTATDRIRRLLPHRAAEAVPAPHLPALLAMRGSACLLDLPVAAAASADSPARGLLTGPEVRVDPNLRLLGHASPAFRHRLLAMIERGEPYFVLTGSDPAEAGGCCPSGEVGYANRLVKAGILWCYRPPTPPDACTSGIYALAGEIDLAEDGPVFSARRELRAKVAAALRAPPVV